MKSSSLEQDKKIGENVIKRLQKDIDDTANKDIKNFFRLKKENETIKDRVIRDIRNLSEQEDDYYKPIRECNF